MLRVAIYHRTLCYVRSILTFVLYPMLREALSPPTLCYVRCFLTLHYVSREAPSHPALCFDRRFLALPYATWGAFYPEPEPHALSHRTLCP